MEVLHDVTGEQMIMADSSQLDNRDELKCMLQTIKSAKINCLRNSIIFDTLKEHLGRREKYHVSSANEITVPATVASKVARLVCLERLSGDGNAAECREQENDEAVNLLGLSWGSVAWRGSDMLEVEKQLVRAAVEQDVLKKQHFQLPRKFAAENSNDNKYDTRDDVAMEQVLYNHMMKNHATLHDHLAQLTDVLNKRQYIVEEILPQKTACLESQLEMCLAQKRCMNAALLDIILTDVPKLPKALKLAYRQIKDENDSMVLAIDRMKNLMAAYKKLKGTKFDMILLNYKSILREIEHTNWGLHSLK